MFLLFPTDDFFIPIISFSIEKNIFNFKICYVHNKTNETKNRL